MTVSLINKFAVTALAVALVGCASTGQQSEGKYSGFLGDYSQLKPVTDSAGNEFERALSPSFNPKLYHSVLIEPVRFYPEPQPSEQVSQAALNGIRAYVQQGVQTTVGKSVPVVTQSGPGVLRMTVAITSVKAKDAGLKAYQYVPIAFVATQASRAVSGKPQEATIFIEMEARDGVTGERMVSAVRSGTGKDFKPSADGQVTVDSLKPLLDKWAEGASQEVPKLVQGKR